MADETPRKPRDWRPALELASKVIGGFGVPIVGLALTYALHQQTQSSQQAQVCANITSGREKADSDVRSQMFSKLLERYLVCMKPASFRCPSSEAMMSSLLGRFSGSSRAGPLYETRRFRLNSSRDQGRGARRASRPYPHRVPLRGRTTSAAVPSRIPGRRPARTS